MQFLVNILPAHFTRRARIIFFLALLFSFASLIALLKVQPKDEDQSPPDCASICSCIAELPMTSSLQNRPIQPIDRHLVWRHRLLEVL